MLRGLLQTTAFYIGAIRGGDDASLFWLRVASSNYTPLKRKVNHRSLSLDPSDPCPTRHPK